MPVRRSSNNSGADKVSRKVKVVLGNSKGLGDDVRTPRSKSSNDVRTPRSKSSNDFRTPSYKSSNDVRTPGSKSSNVDKAHRKVRIAVEGSKGSSGGVRTVEAKRKGSKKMQSRGNGDDAVSYVNVNEKSSETRSRRERDFKTKRGSEGFEAVIDGKAGRKRKRISADPGTVEERMFDGNDRKSRSKSRNNVVKSYLDKGKKMSKRKDGELKDSRRNTVVTESTEFRGSESLDKKFSRGKIKGADKLKHVQDNALQNGTSKISNKKKTSLATQKDLNQRKNAVGSVEKSHKKKDQGKKSLGTDSDLTEDRPKKKKRLIRIDPHDISNKRLDDGIADNGNSQEKRDLTESTGVEMSKNAQFRAIRPSSSILSFVEDNLLGRRRDIEFRRAGYNTELSAPLDNIPFSTSSERERIEVPGRSNVGKSSLLNALTRQWGVVRTSDKPGLTQSINFFKLGSKLCLVDLPGYGFAYAKEEVKEAWEELVKEYVMTRVGLKRVCLLIDTKWGMKPGDLELIDLMERSQTKYQIVLTKTDLVFPIDVARRAMQIEENLKAKKSAVQPLMMVSSKTGAGIRSLRTVLANIARLVRH